MDEQNLRELLRAQLAALGLAVDEAGVEALLPGYTGLLAGSRRLASLDLGEREPAMIFPPHRPAESTAPAAGTG
jgi:hypothetical protein